MSNEFNLEDYEFEFVEDNDLESVAGGLKIGSVYITCK